MPRITSSGGSGPHVHEQGDVSGLVSDLGNKQALNSNLTTISGLATTTDNSMMAMSSNWASRTPAQAKTALALVKADVGLGSVDNTTDANKPVSTATQTALDLKQSLDADLTTIAGLTATTDNVIQSVASAWASRTPAQLKTSMAFVKGDVGLGNVDNTSDASKAFTAAQTTSGLFANARIATGTPNGTKFLRDDQVWTAPTASAAVSETEIDFGATPSGPRRFTITDAAITATSKLLISQSGITPTGGFGDEAELDPMTLIAVPAAGSMTLTATPMAGLVLGKFKVSYQIGA